MIAPNLADQYLRPQNASVIMMLAASRANLLDELYACTSWTSVPHFGKAGRRSPPTGATERERGTLPLVNKTKLSTASKIRVFACLREQP